MIDDAVANSSADGQSTSRAWRSSFAVHVCAVAAALAALFFLTPRSDIALPDEGVYLAQVSGLAQGTWWVERALPKEPPKSYTDAVLPETVLGSLMVPYSKRPLLSVLLLPGYGLNGVSGVLAIPLIGLLIASVASARIAAAIDARASLPTLWITALGSPLLFSGRQISGHSLAAAAAAVGALAAIRCARRGRASWFLALAVAAFTCVSLRSEGLVLCAVGAGVIVGSTVWAGLVSRKLNWAGLAAGGVVATAAVAAYVTTVHWAKAITGSSRAVSGLSYVEAIVRAPLGAAWAALLRPWDGNGLTANHFLILSGLFLVVSALSWRLAPRHPLAAATSLLASASCAIAALTIAPSLVNGLIPTFPVLPAGLILLRRNSLNRPEVQCLLATSLLTAVALCFLVYEDGGATQWGGRFFHLLIPLLTPIVGVSAVRSLKRVGSRSRLLTGIGVGVVAIALSTVGVRVDLRYREAHRAIRTTAESQVARSSSAVSPRSILVIASPATDGFSRMFWRDEPNFVTVRESMSSTFSLLLRLERHGLTSAYVLTPGDVRLLEFGGRNDLEKLGWVRLSTDRVPGTSVHLLKYGPPRHDSD